MYSKLNNMYDEVVRSIGTNHVRDEIIPAMVGAKEYVGNINVMMEIGSYRGGNIPIYSVIVEDDGLVIVVDPEIQVPLEIDVINDMIDPLEVHHIRRYSTEPGTYDDVVSILDGRKVDFLMIGGDHREPIVRADWEIYRDLVASPGIVMFHDIRDRFQHGPQIVYSELCRNYVNRRYVADPMKLGIGAIYM